MRKPSLPRLAFAAALIIMLASCKSKDESGYWLDKASGKDPSEALSVYKEGLRETRSSEIYYNLAYTCLLLGDWEGAVETADEALREFPGMIRFEYLKAYALKESGRAYAYETQLERILAFDPGNAYIRDTLAELYADSGRKEKAIALAKDSIARNADDSRAINVLAKYIGFYASLSQSTPEEREFFRDSWDRIHDLPDLRSFLALEERFPEEYLEDVSRRQTSDISPDFTESGKGLLEEESIEYEEWEEEELDDE